MTRIREHARKTGNAAAVAMALGAWVLLHIYAGRPLLLAAGPFSWGPVVAWTAIACLSIFPLIGFFASRAEGIPHRRLIETIGFAALGISSLLLALALFSDIARGVVRLAAIVLPALPGTGSFWLADPGNAAIVISMINAGTLVVLVLLLGIGLLQARCPRVVNVEVPIEGLSESLEGLTIAQLSDLHVGPTIERRFVERVVETTNALDADLVVITGDLGDGAPSGLRDALAPLRRLEARHGVFYVTGNHEYYWDADAWVATVRSLGIEPLLNEHRVIVRDGAVVTVAGVTDLQARHFDPDRPSDPDEAMRGAPEGSLKILLAHQPQTADAARHLGIDLQLSGHTHGGQYFPFNLLIRLFQPIVSGLHRTGQGWLYVSRGTGYWGPPNRLGVPGEITLLRLVSR